MPVFGSRKLRVLDVDLAERTSSCREDASLGEELGGIGVASRLFLGALKEGRDSAELPFVLANGPLTTIFPLATKTVAVFCSPLTGEWGESYAGMRLAMALRFSGYDAVVVRGRATAPVYVTISGQGARFHDARALWGLSVEETGRKLREWEPGRGFRSTIRIGPAGETGVAFANVNVDTFRHFGRLGLGSLMGSRNLKAIVVIGNQAQPIRQVREYRGVYDKIYRRAVATDAMSKYHDEGTAQNVLHLSGIGALPTHNLQAGTMPDASGISGETFARETLIRKLACPGCPVGCIHVGLYRHQFGDGYEFESTALAYDFELLYALGSFLGLSRTGDVFPLIDRVEAYGLDAITTGVLMGWCTEALARGLIAASDLGTSLEFGDPKGYLFFLDRLIAPPNDLYRVLRQGLAHTVSELGGGEFACLHGGVEMAGYHTGYGSLLGHSLAARHSHLCNAGYALDQDPGLAADPDRMVAALLSEEKWRNVLNSLCICLFARGIYDEETVIEALQAIGIPVAKADLTALGERVFRTKLEAKRLLGFDGRQVRFPKRFFDTPTPQGELKPEVAEAILSHYWMRVGN